MRLINADELEKRTVLVESDDFDGEYVIPYASFESMPTVDAIPKISTTKWKVFDGEHCPQCTQCRTLMPFARYRRRTKSKQESAADTKMVRSENGIKRTH